MKSFNLAKYVILMNKIKPTVIFLILIGTLLATSCGGDSKENRVENQLKQTKLDSILSQPIQTPSQVVQLNDEAQNLTKDWLLYIAMESEIKRMNNYTLDDVMANSQTILQATDTLMKTLPDTFKIKPVEARMKVLHTKASVLHQLSQKQQKDFIKIKTVAEEVPVDFQNLNIQLNEVFIEFPDLEKVNQ